MATAIRDDNPVVYLHHYLLTLEHGEVPDGEYLVPFGEAAIRREGGDVTIVGTGWTVDRALGAAEQLAAEGIEAEVIDPRTLAPLDTQTILESVDEDRPARARRPGDAPRIGLDGDRRRGRRARLRLAQGADRAGHRARRDGAVQRAARGLRDADEDKVVSRRAAGRSASAPVDGVVERRAARW